MRFFINSSRTKYYFLLILPFNQFLSYFFSHGWSKYRLRFIPLLIDYVHTVSFSLGFYIVLCPQGIRKQMKTTRKRHRVHIALESAGRYWLPTVTFALWKVSATNGGNIGPALMGATTDLHYRIFARVKTHNLLQVVNWPAMYWTMWTMLCCTTWAMCYTTWTMLSTRLFSHENNVVRASLFVQQHCSAVITVLYQPLFNQQCCNNLCCF